MKNTEFEEIRSKHESIENETLALKQCRKNLQSKLALLARKIREIDAKISDITQENLGPRVEEDTLLEEKAALTDRLEQLKVQHGPQKEKIDAVKREMNELDAAIKALDERHVEYDTKLQEARAKVELLMDKRERLEIDKSEKIHHLQELEQRVTNLREETEDHRHQVEQMAVALGGNRMRTRKSREEVRDNIAALNAQRQVSTQIKETLEEVGEELAILDERIEELDLQYEVGCKTLRVVSY